MYVIKAIYPSGGHIVMLDGNPLRFKEKQDAEDRAEILSAASRSTAARNSRPYDTSYIVVEEHI